MSVVPRGDEESHNFMADVNWKKCEASRTSRHTAVNACKGALHEGS